MVPTCVILTFFVATNKVLTMYTSFLHFYIIKLINNEKNQMAQKGVRRSVFKW